MGILLFIAMSAEKSFGENRTYNFNGYYMTFEEWWNGFSEKEEFKNYKWIAEIGWCAGQSEMRVDINEEQEKLDNLTYAAAMKRGW